MHNVYKYLNYAIILIVIFLNSNCYSNEILIFPDQNATNKTVNLIKKARKSLKISMYRIENQDIINSIIDAKNRNVDVAVILGSSEKGIGFKYDEHYNKTFEKLNKNTNAFNLFNQSNILVKFSDPKMFFSYHPKFMIIDNKIGLLGASNFNDNGFFNARNFVFITQDAHIISSLDKLFANDINNKQTIWSDKYLAVSPGNYLEKIYEIIDSAKQEIYL
jgi:phosphatidylserine/phosphatidylglycerophosphate/cardiolipin synthase-like enzyme